MAAAVASAPTFATSANPHLFVSPSIDARLNLSLDDLIKERRKETKKEVKQLKKRENVKQEQSSPSKKTDAKQQKKKAAANAQTEKRKDKMNKNRGLPVAQPKQQQSKKKNAQSPGEMGNMNSTGKSAKKLQRKKAKKAGVTVAGQKGTSPKAKQQPQKTMNQSKNTKKSFSSPKNSKQQRSQQPQLTAPKLSPKQQSTKTMTFTVKTAKGKGARAVNKTAKGSKLQITLVRSDAELRRTKQQKRFEKQRQTVLPPAKKKMNSKAAKSLLPGKAQPKTRKVLAQTLVTKANASRKQWTSKNGKFIVRKPVVVRRA